MVILEPEEKGVRYRRTSWLSSIPLLAFVVIAYVAFVSGGADFTLTRFFVPMPSGAAGVTANVIPPPVPATCKPVPAAA